MKLALPHPSGSAQSTAAADAIGDRIGARLHCRWPAYLERQPLGVREITELLAKSSREWLRPKNVLPGSR
jgi:hypothetical protein